MVFLYAGMAVVAGLVLFFVGIFYGAKLEKNRFDKAYPPIGRIRIIGENTVKLDFGVDLIDLGEEYTGARIKIEKGAPSDYATVIKEMSDDEMIETYADAIEIRDALKTDPMMAEAKKNKED